VTRARDLGVPLPGAPGPAPDLLLLGGTVRTMDDRPGAPATATAVAVRDGLVLAVGGDEVTALRGPRTELVDLAGGTLLPGFVDAHLHPVAGGLARSQCDLSGVHGLAAYRDLIGRYAAGHDGPCIEGSGWYGDAFPGGFPTRDELDRLVPDRPALFTSHDYHGVWVNSRALELAGIHAGTPDPDGGRIVRDADGRPTGLLLEAAGELVGPVRPPLDAARLEQALQLAQQHLHSLGVTAWQDALVGEFLALPDSYDLYRRADQAGRLVSRVTGALWWPLGADDDTLDRLVARRAAATGRFRATAVKIVQDGVCENLTAAVLAAYRGTAGETGLSFFEPARLVEVAALVAAVGFDLHVHAVGDRAVRECLDAVQALPPAQRGPGRRHQVAHIDLVTDPDVRRMRDLGVIANVSPLWARHDPVLVETKLPYLTEDQQEHHFAFGALHRAGVPLAFGSDWPVSSPDPVWAVHTAVNRTAPPGDVHAPDRRSQTDPLLPAERLPVEVALAAATRVGARAAGLDGQAGVVRAGLEADLVLLDRDPLTVRPEELGDLRVRLTMVRGAVVHRAR
jgi:predicted amidohydrolase YtcJ